MLIFGSVVFLVGAGLTWALVGRAASPSPLPATVADSAAQGPAPLSAATESIVKKLRAPVEIRFYNLVDPASAPRNVLEYAQRVDQLLSQYEADGSNRIKVTRRVWKSYADGNAAVADGLKPIQFGKGDESFLGMAVTCGGQTLAISQLSPDWEAALESDVTRAIAQVSAEKAASDPAPKIDPSAEAAVQRPDLQGLSGDQGAETLRSEAVSQLEAASKEMTAQVQAAQQRYLQAQAAGSASEEQAAADEIQKAQADGRARMRQIADRSHAQILAFQQLKKDMP